MALSVRAICLRVVTCLFLALLVILGGLSLLNLRGAVPALRASCSLGAFRECLNRELAERFPGKFGFVDLNGAYCRMLGFRLCNRRMRYRNGMLGRPYETFVGDLLTAIPACIRAEDAFCRARDIPFLFVLAPCKIDLNGDLFPAGWRAENPNRMGMRVAETLAADGVDVLNLIPRFAETSESVGRSFFETDHHWRYETALAASALLVDRLGQRLSDETLRGQENLRAANWRWKDEGRTFLGSHGRKVGRFFGGFSRFRYCLPRFPTAMRRRNLSRGKTYEGPFEKAIFVGRLLKIRNPYGANKYAIYTGPDVGLQLLENSRAPNARCVMIVKDSFGDPVTAFLATVFRSVIQVDPRRLEKGESVEHLIEIHHPDAVVDLCGSSSLFADNERWK